MKNLSIEKFVSRRYRAMRGSTISLGLLAAVFFVFLGIYGHGISDDYSSTLFLLFISLMIVLQLVFFAFIIYHLIIRLKIRRNPVLNAALNDEVNIYNYYRSYAWGFYGFTAAVCICLLLALTGINGVLACGTALITGVMSMLISWLIYNK